jgi:predicted RNA binding protein YcfA (HicA-like mRNA interferase family)
MKARMEMRSKGSRRRFEHPEQPGLITVPGCAAVGVPGV